MKTHIYFAAAAASALSLAACGGNKAEDNSAGSAMENLTTAPEDDAANVSVATNPTTAAEFANMAAASDAYEIQSSQMAATKGAHTGVKSFAAMLVKDHTKSTADLKAAAGKATPAVTPTPTLTAEQQANLDALKAAPNGAEFDRLYLQQQVPAHEKALAMLQGYAAGGDTPAIKEFATKTAPVVEKHLAEARTMAAK